MVETVTKRSGEKQPYDASKIEKSVVEAAGDAGIIGAEVESASRAVMEAVSQNAGDRTDVSTNEIREWALSTLDGINKKIAEAWRAYEAKKGQ